MIGTTRELLDAAQRDGYAVGAFDVVSLEIVFSLLKMAERHRAPIILMIGAEAQPVLPEKVLVYAIRQLMSDSAVPAALALDHATSMEAVIRAIEMGFTGVMIDGSHLPFQENVQLTRQVIEVAHDAGVSVEAEIGHVDRAGSGGHSGQRLLTDPSEAERFRELTGVDSLAVAVGTVHGRVEGSPELDFQRLRSIRRRVGVPLVLHGSSGVAPEDLLRCVELGITKVNVFTDLAERARRELQTSLEARQGPSGWLRAINRGFSEVAQAYVTLLGSADRV